MVVTLKRREAAAKEVKMVAANRNPAISPETLKAKGGKFQALKIGTKRAMAARGLAPRNNSQGLIPEERAPQKMRNIPPQRPGIPKKKTEKDRERKRRSFTVAGRRWMRLEPG
jgi:hypothetical protein